MNDEWVQQAARSLRRRRVFVATAAFGVPSDAHQQCAEGIARAVIAAVEDSIRADERIRMLERCRCGDARIRHYTPDDQTEFCSDCPCGGFVPGKSTLRAKDPR